MAIGCQQHTIEEWKNFDDEVISKMDSNALEWWSRYKTVLFSLIDLELENDDMKEEEK